jgi:SpoVK/Ycf46/Vps4 family AAA+-type ATPase
MEEIIKTIDLNTILERKTIADEIKAQLLLFDKNCDNVQYKKGFYIYGSPGCGKTSFVTELLKELNYDIIKYDAGDVRNKNLIDTIASDNMSNQNVLSMMTRKVKKLAIVMDEIDGMNNGDKGGITALIKLIRQKKTKKQRLESTTKNPIICIGNYCVDKKIKELIKVCNVYELKSATNNQMRTIVTKIIPSVNTQPSITMDILLNYIQSDMRKLGFVYDMFKSGSELLNAEIIQTIFHTKMYNEDSKKITNALINVPTHISKHAQIMNETERTIVALLWHENIVDTFSSCSKKRSMPVYLQLLKNMCYADYIDRITFQYQIWQFNEMSSLIKTFYNNYIYHKAFPENKNKFKPSEIRFTKVLTKYSTEYNNMIFITTLCQELDMDKSDLIAMFQELRVNNGEDFCNQPLRINDYEAIFINNNITKLDIKRMYRYLDKNVKKDLLNMNDELADDMSL